MIREIRDYIKERKRVSMQDLSIHFKMDKSALEAIISRLEKNGNVSVEQDEKCVGCADSCVFAGKPMVIILWKDSTT